MDTLDYPVTWLSLDAADDDPGRFFAYLIAALQKVDANLGQEEGLVLYQSCHVFLTVQLGEKLAGFLRIHLQRMAFVASLPVSGNPKLFKDKSYDTMSIDSAKSHHPVCTRPGYRGSISKVAALW